MTDSRPQIEREIRERLASVDVDSLDNEKVMRTILVSMTRMEVKQDYFQLGLDANTRALSDHRREDKDSFAALEGRLGNVTSQVGGLDGLRNQFIGGRATIGWIAGLAAFVITTIIAVAALLK